MQIRVDASELRAMRQQAGQWTPELKRRAWKAVRVVAFNGERRLKMRTPVDTGRARASWGHATAPAGAGDGIWEEDEGNLTLTLGSRVVYMQRLNEGHSRQAPAGFVDAEEQAIRQELEELIADAIEELFR